MKGNIFKKFTSQLCHYCDYLICKKHPKKRCKWYKQEVKHFYRKKGKQDKYVQSQEDYYE